MNTPTPTPRTDAATYPADCLGKTLVTNRDCARAIETELVTLTGAYTCTHHNDQQRAACPVCLVSALTAERAELRAEVARLRAGIEVCLRTNAHLADGENCTLIDLKHCLRDSRVERAEAAETVALAQWNGALERAMKLDAELAAERARLDWVFRNCKVTADDYTTGHRDVYAIHDREDLGAAMKEGAK